MFKKFIPDYHFKSIYDIDYNYFLNKGYKVVMLDLDNTLIPYHEKMPNKELILWKEKLLELGFILIIVSNSRKERVEKFAESFGLLCVKFAKKPFKKGFKEALKILEYKYKPNEILFIGDQLLTDIYGSNRVSFTSILIDPINSKTEALITKINRLIEAFFRKLTCLFNKEAKAKFYKYEETSND